MNKYLLIGASGFIGSHILDYCQQNGHYCVGTYASKPGYGLLKFNLLSDDAELFLDGFNNEQLTHAIICSAQANIDKCLIEEKGSYTVNVTSMRKLIDALISHNIMPCFFSSEYVFDGQYPLHEEDDIPIPVTKYGYHKYLIEKYIQEVTDIFLIFRVSKAVATKPGSRDILQEFEERFSKDEDVCCIKGQSFTLTDVDDIARSAVEACEHGLCGIYHLSADQNHITRCDLARLYLQHYPESSSQVLERDLNSFGFTDTRNIIGGLSSKKIREALQLGFKSIEEIIRLRQMAGGSHND